MKYADGQINDFENNLKNFSSTDPDADFLALQLISSLDGIISYKLPISSIVKTASDLNLLTDLEIANPAALLTHAESWLNLYAARENPQLIKLFSLNKDLFLKRLAAYNIVLARIVADQNIFFVRDRFFGVDYFNKVGNFISLYETKVKQPSFQTFQEKFKAIHLVD